MMRDSEKNLPLEQKSFQVEIDGYKKEVPGISKTWVDLKKRHFNRYISHPVQVNGSFAAGEKEIWLELMEFIQSDLKWLLQQEHHIFWSHMIFSKDARQLLITFLQEAPPYYLRNEFPKIYAMEKALEKIEELVFLVFIRLSTQKESDSCYVSNLGDLLYEHYLFTVPIILDICLIYGVSNRDLVVKMVDEVIAAAPQYMNDFLEIGPHFLHVLSLVKNKFDSYEMTKFSDKSVSKAKEIRDLILHLYDSSANIQIFLDIHPNGSKLFRTDSFTSEVASFYTSAIPQIYKIVKKFDCDLLRTWNFLDKINDIRLDLLSVVRSVFCGIINDVLNDFNQKEEYANEYLAKTVEMLQESLFLSDYNQTYPIDADMKVLREVCQEMDSENLRYISEAIAPLHVVSPSNHVSEVVGVELESLITQVKDILPNLGDGFVEACVKYYEFNTERVIAAILENKLPPDLERLDRNLSRPEEVVEVVPSTKPRDLARMEEFRETQDVLDDKTDVHELRDRYAQLGLISDDEYNDEYDDTYDSQDVSIRGGDDADRERRPFVVPRVLRPKDERGDDDDDEEEDEAAEEETSSAKKMDYFVPNPAEIRAKQEAKRLERARRDCVGRGKGRGQDKQVLMNRDFKDTHKSFMANHNRRKLASRKRNLPFIHS